ncbi:MAG: hypothetical protein AAF907_11450 [Planctomycetota bacterium]
MSYSVTRRSTVFVAAFALAFPASVLAQDDVAVDPFAESAELPLSVGYEADVMPTESGLPFPLQFGDDPSVMVRLIDDGQVVAEAAPGENGLFTLGGGVKPGVYTAFSQSPAGVAVFGYRINIAENGSPTMSAPPVRLLAPAGDLPLVASLILQQFPQLAGPTVPTVPGAPAAAPGSAPMPQRVAATPASMTRTTVRRMGGVRAGGMGQVFRFDDANAATPVPNASVLFVQNARLVSRGLTDAQGMFEVPSVLSPGLYTMATISETGASIMGVQVLGKALNSNDALEVRRTDADDRLTVRPVVRRVVRQIPDFSVAEGDVDDLGGFFLQGAGGPGVGVPGFGGGAGIAGAGAGAGGGGALLAGIIGGIAWAIAENNDDDGGGAAPPVGGTPPAASPLAP